MSKIVCLLVATAVIPALGGDYKTNPKTDYQKYMQGGSQGGSQGGDYQQYMKQYANDYKKYMRGGSQGGFQGGAVELSVVKTSAGKQSAGSASGTDYQQYMKQYGGDYEKYMQQSSQGGAQGGNYQQYMKKYGGDYQKYMQQSSQGGSQGGDYQQYMKQYAGDYQKYMQKGGGAKNATELTSEDFKQLYAGKWQPLNKNMTQEEALHQYAAGYVPSVKNTSDHKAWAEAFLGSAAADYMTQRNGGQPEEAHTVKELEEWRKNQLKKISTFVPESYRPKAEAAVEAKFKSNLARIDEQSETKPSKEFVESEPAVEKELAEPSLALEKERIESELTLDSERTESQPAVEKKAADSEQSEQDSRENLADQKELVSSGSTMLIAKQVATSNVTPIVPLMGMGVFAACAFAFVARRTSQNTESEGYLNLAEP